MSSTRLRVQSWPLLFAILLATLIGGRAAAQEVTGAIQGTVVSAESGPEPEVRLSLAGPHLQGSRTTKTDRRGFFQFLAVPPGTYGLTVERIGLQPMEVKQVIVELGRTTAIPTLTLAVQPITMEPVVVQAPRITLDPAHTEAGGTLRTAEYETLPVDRDYKSLIAILPQANESRRGDPVNVGGSTGLENQYYIDGVMVTDVKGADRATSLPYNFVRAVEVKTGGYEAEFGRALGAVVNAVTYSGTNDFEASVFGFGQPSGLTMDARTISGVAALQPDVYDWGARLGGPVARDRLWYSAAVNPRVSRVDKAITGFGSFTDRTQALRFASKLTWQASPATNLELSVLGDPTVRDVVDGLPSGITSVENPDGLLSRVETGGTVGSLRATVTPSPSLLLQASLSRQWDRYSEHPATALGRSEVPYTDYVQGSFEGGRWSKGFKEDRSRTSLTARGTLLVPGHTVVAGVDYQDAAVSGSNYGVGVFRLDTSLYALDLEHYQGTVRNRSPAAYLQDSWRITDRLTVNPGLRWSGQYLIGASGRTAERIPDEWQPRIGFSWQMGGAPTQRIFGSYGRFYETLPLSLSALRFVDYWSWFSYYHVDPRLPGSTPDSVFDATTLEAAFAKQIPGLQAENFDEFTLGYERLLGEETKLTVRAMRRDLRSAFLQGLDLSQSPWVFVMGTPGQGSFSFLPPPKRQYTALEVAAEGSWRSWQCRGSYVLSRLWGNYSGFWDQDHPGDSGQGGTSYFQLPYQAKNSTGLLPSDHPHVFKLSGAYNWRFGLEAGGILTYESGAPINDFAGGLLPDFSYFLVPRGSAGRLPALWDLGLRFAYDLPAARGSHVQVLLDVLHVGNPRRAVMVDEMQYVTVDASGDPTSPNPNYLHATAYQPPMAVRLGIQASL